MQAVATKLKPNQLKNRELYARQVVDEKWTRSD